MHGAQLARTPFPAWPHETKIPQVCRQGASNSLLKLLSFLGLRFCNLRTAQTTHSSHPQTTTPW